MSYLINNQQKMNDVIFADRNKSYGAYAIRSEYGNTIFKSLSFVALGFGTFMSLAFYITNKNNLPDQKNEQLLLNDSNIVTVFNIEPLEEKIEPVKTIEKGAKPASSIATTLATRINDSLTVETNTLLNTEVKVSATTTGTATTAIGSESLGTSTGSAVSTGTGSVAKEFYFVDTPPEFEGGIKALYKFIADNVNYPEVAIEEGKEGTVYVKFVVDEAGKVGNLNLLNSLGYGMDAEALRVVALIPKFKSPAKIKGQAVKVYYQLPIRYKIR
jgi:protein TonB